MGIERPKVQAGGGEEGERGGGREGGMPVKVQSALFYSSSSCLALGRYILGIQTEG